MSRQSKVGFGIPQSTRGSRSSASKVGTTSKTSCGPCGPGKPTKAPAGQAGAKKFSIPPISVLPKARPVDPVLEKLKKKTIRRNAPEGEDIKKIKDTIRGLRNEPVSVQEFVGLIAPYTGDNGNALRAVMGDDLSSFRKMAKRVYDTMTQDVSDVLANEQIHLTEYYNERYTLYMEKMMRTIDEIYRYCPNFDFEQYYENPVGYLDKLFPLPQASMVAIDPEEEEMHRRQEAYHRLQWLRSEGTRLSEENGQLQGRLKEIKRQQQDELETARKQEELAEVRKTHLEATQADLQTQLEELNESVEKSFISTEEELRLTAEANVMKKHSKPRVSKQRLSRPEKRPSSATGQSWNVRTAKVLEDTSMFKSATSALSNVSVVSSSSKTGLKKGTGAKSKIKFRRPPPQPTQSRDKSPFHFSPIKTPPKRQERERSPFHYSPPKTPPPAARASSPCGATQGEACSAAYAQHAQQQAPQGRQLPAARRNRAPRDSWSGFD